MTSVNPNVVAPHAALLAALATLCIKTAVGLNFLGHRYQCPSYGTRGDCLFDASCVWWNRVEAGETDLCVTWSSHDTKPFGSCAEYKEYMQNNIFNCLSC